MQIFKRHLAVLLLAVACFLLAACQDRPTAGSAAAERPVKIGYHPNPLLGPLYAVNGKGSGWKLVTFGTGGDVGYSLLSGEVEAGFVDTEKALKLIKAPGGERLKVAGVIQFPYGATLVVRKDLKLRLGDLKGKHLAALEADCIINHQFNKDARKHGLDPKSIRYSYMPFADMLPALESKSIDGALVKGAHGVLAELAGHKILYQNWEIKAGADDCCPPAIAQAEYFLVVREQAVERVKPLVAALTTTNDLPPSSLRQAIAANLGYPVAALEQYPTSTFAAVSEDLKKMLGEQRCLLTK
ncbi:ABC transporter substrate-binding protein [Geobacter sp. SVR]|uniref:ABC transporter substrate-binding protein n=1 Tax=Geobacter sp. SVR TaxID=2495594 RepID=UPI00143F057B|nr:ABC transporter substrate-binding protein [Geobacter sp. SVR]BCS54135.1 hypothetical protein GSVR_24430 [Geobacter sp. SVR]GCF87697.1 hypothetical protein GSbR_42970 [Geobacter sp. SVR]